MLFESCYKSQLNFIEPYFYYLSSTLRMVNTLNCFRIAKNTAIKCFLVSLKLICIQGELSKQQNCAKVLVTKWSKVSCECFKRKMTTICNVFVTI